MKILVVDDHPIVRAGLKRLFADEIPVEMHEAADGKEALARYREVRPDIVVLDLNLPGLGGLELMKRLRLEDPRARILVLSMQDAPIFALRALEAGACGYVSKNAPPEEVLEAVRRVAKGDSYVAQTLAQELAVLNIRSEGHPLGNLSRRDFEILRLLGAGKSLREIADALGVSYKTVANTCSHIKLKLGVERTTDLVRFALQNRVSPGI